MNHGLPIHADQVERQVWDAGEIQAQRRRLGAAVSAARLGVALIEIEPGKRSTPPHSHVDEDEVFLVLKGTGVSYQLGASGPRTWEIGVDDLILHPSGGDAHTLIAGGGGLTVLVVEIGRAHV